MKFSEVLASLRPNANEWIAAAPPEWAQGRTIFGGLQAALLVRAMRLALIEARDLPLRSLQLTFVAPVAPGVDVRLQPQLLRTGRSATHARCDLFSADQLACCGVAIFGAARASAFVREAPRCDGNVDPESLADVPFIPGLMPELVKNFQMRWAVGRPPYSGSSEPRSVIYVRLRDTDGGPEDALLALADSIPTPALSMLRTPAPASSLNWMIELLGNPADFDQTAWSMIGTEVRAGVDGYLSQTSILWGPGGHAFSVSHQSVAIFG